MVSKECALAGDNDFGRVSNRTVAAEIFTHLSVASSRQRSYDCMRCEEKMKWTCKKVVQKKE